MKRKINMNLIESTRLNQGFDKTTFCKSNRIGVATYNRILRDPEARIKDNTILRIAQALGMEPSDLINFC
jgi:DNA-binding Xre family transcriptional regulator